MHSCWRERLSPYPLTAVTMEAELRTRIQDCECLLQQLKEQETAMQIGKGDTADEVILSERLMQLYQVWKCGFSGFMRRLKGM